MYDDVVYNDNFIWHRLKNELNVHYHKISFETATCVFDDPFAVVGYDLANSNEQEDRYKITGMLQFRNSFVTVSFTPRGELTRIFSARKADEKEKEAYIENTRRILG